MAPTANSFCLFKMSRLKTKKAIILTLISVIIFSGLFYYLIDVFLAKAQEQIKIFPTNFSGDWQNPEAAFSQDLDEMAASIEFNIVNSAYLLETSELPIEETATPPQEGIVSLAGRSLELSNFSVPEEFKENKINNVQLRASLAGKGEVGDKLIIEYYYQDSWQSLTSFDLKNEISNALNGGYFLYGLPVFENWRDLGSLKIRFTYFGRQGVYLDSVWLEVEYGGEKQIHKQPISIADIKFTLGWIDRLVNRQEARVLEGLSRYFSEENLEFLKGLTPGQTIKISGCGKYKLPEGEGRICMEDLDWSWEELENGFVVKTMSGPSPIGIRCIFGEDKKHFTIQPYFTNLDSSAAEDVAYEFIIEYPQEFSFNEADATLLIREKKLTINPDPEGFKSFSMQNLSTNREGYQRKEISLYVGTVESGGYSEVSIDLW